MCTFRPCTVRHVGVVPSRTIVNLQMGWESDCGSPGLDASGCEARGCVWVPGFRGPWCQFPAWNDLGQGELEGTAIPYDASQFDLGPPGGWSGMVSAPVWKSGDDPFVWMLPLSLACLYVLCAAAGACRTHRVADRSCVAVLSLLSVASRFHKLSEPGRIVLDEVHFGKFVNRYWSSHYYFDIHPPVAKLVLAGLGWLGGHDADFDFSVNGKAFERESQYVILRRASALFGAALPVLAYVQLRVWRLRPHAAAFGAGLLLFEGMHVTQARHVLLDSQLLAYQSAALLCASLMWNSKLESFARRVFLAVAAACFSALGALVKVTGLAMVGLVVLESAFALTLAAEEGPLDVAEVVPMAVAFAITEVAAFAAHFILLHSTGNFGDYRYDDYHSAAFRASLKGADAEDVTPLGFIGKFLELNYRMTERSAAIETRHPAESRWTTWPTDAVGFLYYKRGVTLSEAAYDASTPRLRVVFLIGNPAVIYLTTLAVIAWSVHLALQIRGNSTFRDALRIVHGLDGGVQAGGQRDQFLQSSRLAPSSQDSKELNGTRMCHGNEPAKANTVNTPMDRLPREGKVSGRQRRHAAQACFLLVGWAANVFPFMMVKRSTWIYHYMGAEYLAVLLAAVAFDKFMPQKKGRRGALLFASLAPAAAFAAFLAP